MRALALTVSRGGTKLTAGEPSGRADVIAMSNGTDLKNHTMPQLAHYLSRLPIGLPVVDKTGLDGRYNVHIDLAQLAAGKKPDAAVGRDGSPIDPPSTISNDALRPYGLELQSRKLPVDVIVIDAARIDPTPN